MQIGVLDLRLRPDVDGQAFESFIASEIFPLTAELPGSINRGSVSAI